MIKIEIEVNDEEECGMTEQQLGDFICMILKAHNKTVKRPGFSFRQTPVLWHDLTTALDKLDGAAMHHSERVLLRCTEVAASALAVYAGSIPCGPDTVPNAS